MPSQRSNGALRERERARGGARPVQRPRIASASQADRSHGVGRHRGGGERIVASHGRVAIEDSRAPRRAATGTDAPAATRLSRCSRRCRCLGIRRCLGHVAGFARSRRAASPADDPTAQGLARPHFRSHRADRWDCIHGIHQSGHLRGVTRRSRDRGDRGADRRDRSATGHHTSPRDRGVGPDIRGSSAARGELGLSARSLAGAAPQ